MQSGHDQILAQIRTAIEQRIDEQLERQRRVSPNIDPRKVVDIQIQQEKEKIEKYLEEEENPALASAHRAILDWLPQLAKKLKER
ncbi:MAG TPA: hypothetical protein VK643_12915 [Burkholderiales bacterium]|nr:hypothetical protein [Burkholderiales bacterium]